MPGPIGALFVVFGLGGGALALAGRKKASPQGTATYELDSDLPATTETQVLAALGHETSASALEQLAVQMDAKGFHKSADALRMRAKQIAEEGPPHDDESGGTLDAGIDDATRAAVLVALTTETDPDKLTHFGEAIRTRYPVASSLLYARAITLRAEHGAPPMPMPSADPSGLDASIDAQTKAAVLLALSQEMDAARLYAFAAALQARFPIAAALLISRAQHVAQVPVALPPGPPRPPHPGAPPPHVAPPAPAPGAPPPTVRPPRPRPPAPVPAPHPAPGPVPTPRPAASCPFPLVPGATCVARSSITPAQQHAFATPKPGTWPTPMTSQAQACMRSAPNGVYYVFYAPDGGLYELTKSDHNCTLRVTHDVDASAIDDGSGDMPAPRRAPPPGRVSPHDVPPHGGPLPSAGPLASAPFALQPGLVYVPPAVAATAASAAFAVPAHWDPLLTKQAIAVNSSHAPPGSYYVFFPSEGALYQLTKGGGNTVLKRAPASLDALSGAGVSTSGERLVLLQPRAAGF